MDSLVFLIFICNDCNWTRTQNHLVPKRNSTIWPNWPNNWAVFWVLICTVHSIVSSYHVTYAFQSESTLYSCLNFKELLARSSREIVSVWWNGWVFVYELSGSGFESSFSRLNFRFRACFEQGVPWHSGTYRVWIHSKMRTLHDKKIDSFVMLPFSKIHGIVDFELILQIL